ncbi:MAG: ABC transporter permease [Bacteroidetes bacterium]|nr:ABC transporter permease [Bacteroidota bacterium]
MNKIWILARKELSSFFDSLVAYIIVILFIGIAGLFTWWLGNDIFLSRKATMDSFFAITPWILFFFIPAMTMRTFAEENNTGTIELLLTKAITDWQVIWGKFVACLILILITFAFTLPFYISIWWLGNIDHGAVWAGYLGLFLMSAAYISMGLFTSSVTNNQIVAFLLALIAGIFFHFIFGLLAGSFSGTTGEVLNFLSFTSHLQSMGGGVIDTRDLLFFISLTLLGLVLTESALAKRNVSD